MREANLISEIVAFEGDVDGPSKHFPKGSIVFVADYDDGWFDFEDATGVYYTCEEQPEDVLEYVKEPGKSEIANTSVESYRPVPNMTPLGRRFLLL